MPVDNQRQELFSTRLALKAVRRFGNDLTDAQITDIVARGVERHQNIMDVNAPFIDFDFDVVLDDVEANQRHLVPAPQAFDIRLAKSGKTLLVNELTMRDPRLAAHAREIAKMEGKRLAVQSMHNPSKTTQEATHAAPTALQRLSQANAQKFAEMKKAAE